MHTQYLLYNFNQAVHDTISGHVQPIV